MKKAIFVFIILIFSFLYYMGFLTKRETLPFSKDFFSMESPSATEQIWNFKKTYPFNKKTFDQVYQLKLDRGIRNLPIPSYFLNRETERTRHRGNPDQALELAAYSIKLSPDLPQSYFELASVHWSQNLSPSKIYQILSNFFKGQMARFRHFPTSLRLFYNGSYILTHALLLTFMIFGIVVMIRYLPLYFYNIRKNIRQGISGMIIQTLKIFFLLIPLILRLDILWAILFWSILLWGYLIKREKKIFILFLIVLVYLPFSLRSFSSFLDEPSMDIIMKIHQINHEEWDRTSVEKLQTWLTIHPNDTEVLFTLGLVEKREGHYATAEEYYKKAIQEAPEFSEAISNLGNVYLAQKQTQLAATFYQQAIGLDPTKGAYYYNLYRANSQESYLSSKTDKIFQLARQLDPQLVDRYLEIDSPHANRMVIDEILTTGRLWRRLLRQSIGKEGFLFWMFKGWFEKIPSNPFLLVPVVFLGFLIGMSSYGQTRRFLIRCPMCGTPTYRLYSGTSEKEFICFNCNRIFIQKEKLHPRINEKKSLKVRQFQEQNYFVAKFISFFFVGFGYLWKENSFRGFLCLALFFVFILKLIYWNGVILPPIVPMSLCVYGIIFWSILFLVFYFLSLRGILRFKPRYEIKQ